MGLFKADFPHTIKCADHDLLVFQDEEFFKDLLLFDFFVVVTRLISHVYNKDSVVLDSVHVSPLLVTDSTDYEILVWTHLRHKFLYPLIAWFSMQI